MKKVKRYDVTFTVEVDAEALEKFSAEDALADVISRVEDAWDAGLNVAGPRSKSIHDSYCFEGRYVDDAEVEE